MAILHRTAQRGVTHVLLHEGHLRGRKKISIPVSAVTGVENGIRLSLTKKQLEDLPPADRTVRRSTE